MKEGIIITLYDDAKASPHTHSFIIVDNESGDVIVDEDQIPTNFEDSINSVRVLVETAEDGSLVFHKKTMNLRDILLTFGHSKEMRQRLNNGQIKINNQVVKSFDVECDFDIETFEDLPEFIIESGINLVKLSKRKAFLGLNIMDFFGSPTLKERPTNIEEYAFLSEYVLLSISKKEHFVFKNNQIDKQPYSLTQCQN